MKSTSSSHSATLPRRVARAGFSLNTAFTGASRIRPECGGQSGLCCEPTGRRETSWTSASAVYCPFFKHRPRDCETKGFPLTYPKDLLISRPVYLFVTECLALTLRL